MGRIKRSFVQADRQVIRYIHEKIRQNQDVYLMTDNGDVLAFTRNTAGKAAFRNKVRDRNGNLRDMSNEVYRAKLAADSHTDELAILSEPSSWQEDRQNKHQARNMARHGWDYREAYFEDANGRYYEMALSISRNGNINEVYNVSAMQQRKNTASSLGSSVREDGARTARVGSDNDISVLDPSIAPDEPLNKVLERMLG